jgi:hypothetical protein
LRPGFFSFAACGGLHYLETGKRPDDSMRRLLLKVHLYGGLVTCWYLLIYGWSSLAFNHQWLLPASTSDPLSWERQLRVPDSKDDVELAARVRDGLGLAGWPLPWAMQRTPDGVFSFEMSRPGRNYQIRFDPTTSLVRVEERSTGLRSVIKFLHGNAGGVPNLDWLRSWPMYTEVTTWVVLFAVASGVYLWFKRSNRRRAVLVTVGCGSVLSLLLICYVVKVG